MNVKRFPKAALVLARLSSQCQCQGVSWANRSSVATRLHSRPRRSCAPRFKIDVFQRYNTSFGWVPKDDEGFHRELVTQQQYLNELSQTDRSERARLPRPLLPHRHQVLKFFFE